MSTQHSKSRHRTARQKRIWIVSVLVTVVSAAASAVVTFSADPPDTPARLSSARGPSNAELEAAILSLSREVRGLEEQVDGLTAVPEDALVASHLGRLDQTLSGMTERVALLEDALLTDPAKAVQVPLLSDQLADLGERTDAALAGQQHDIDRLYDLLQASIGALVIGVLSMAIATGFRTRSEARGTDEAFREAFTEGFRRGSKGGPSGRPREEQQGSRAAFQKPPGGPDVE